MREFCCFFGTAIHYRKPHTHEMITMTVRPIPRDKRNQFIIHCNGYVDYYGNGLMICLLGPFRRLIRNKSPNNPFNKLGI